MSRTPPYRISRFPMVRTMSVQIVLILAATLGAGGCTSLQPLPSPEPPVTIPESMYKYVDNAYTIGPEDVLNVHVYGHEDLTIKEPFGVTVSADGSFAYPLLGVVQAAGLTARQLEHQMAQALAEYLVDPQVRITVTGFQSQRVHVVGEVHKPGTYALKRASTLVELLAAASGLTPTAGWEVILMRAPQSANGAGPRATSESAGNRIFRVDLERLVAGDIPQSIRVNSGDTIYVPKAAFFYVYGEVNLPGQYRLERDITVAKALAIAKGMTKFAAKSRIKVQRVVAGQRREFRIRMTDLLQADDVLIVPESIF